MSGLPNVQFVTTNGLGNTSNANGNIGGFITNAVESGDVLFDTTYLFYGLKAAENLGITADYDGVNDVKVHHHIQEFFRVNPEGTLYVRLCDGVDLVDMCDKDENYLSQLLRDGNGLIRQVAVVLNFPVAYLADVTGGIYAGVIDAIPMLHQLITSFNDNKYFIACGFLEGFSLVSAATAPDLKSMLASYNTVGVVVGQDGAITGDANFEKTAAVGTILGLSLKKQVHECYARPIDEFNVQDAAEGAFLTVGLSNGQTYEQWAAEDLDALHDKGYIFFRKFGGGVQGVFANQSHVCSFSTDDIQFSENAEVLNAIDMVVYSEVVSLINKSDYELTSTGRLTLRERKVLETDIRTAIESNLSNSISAITTLVVDPEKDEEGNDYPPMTSDRELRYVLGFRPLGKSANIIIRRGYQL